MLDADEYLHLAIHASARADHHACMFYLRELLKLEPSNARATYLLAVQHAELGLLDRAISELQAALTFEPRLDTARFQLGLLLFDRKRHPDARAHFAALRGSEDPVLRNCSEAMLALADGNLAVARERLATAKSGDRTNHPLIALMQRLVQQLATEPGGAAQGSSEAGAVIEAYRLASS